MLRYTMMLFSAFLASCSGEHSGMDHAHHGSDSDAASGEIMTAQSSATVLYVGEDGDFLTLDHAEIPEIQMGAMRMGFDVVEGVDISTLSKGDEILFDLEAGETIGIRVTRFCVPSRDGADCLD